MKKKVLFVAHHRRDRSPSQRFRYEQYIDYLEQNGFECHFSFLLNAADDKAFYSPGNYLAKLKIFAKSYAHRLLDAIRAVKYDLIFIQREAFMTGTSFFEKEFYKSGAKVIFDFDDSVWLPNVSAGNARLAFLKRPEKTEELIAYSHLVFAGNQYLGDYARRFNDNVVVIPTTVDTDEYKRMEQPRDPKVVTIGWSGSITTIEHLESALPVLTKLKEKYGDRIRFVVMGDEHYRNEALGIQGIAWRREDEVRVLSSFDIGIMPLPDNQWTAGKCGLKGLTYMSVETPTIMSPVGVNKEIIEDGANGFLADSDDEWLAKIERLINEPELAQRLAKAGRETVLKKYSVYSQRDRYVHYFNEVLGGGH